MTKYREILRLTALGLSQRNIVQSIGVSQKTVVKVQKRAREMHLSWPLGENLTDAALETLMFPKESKVSKQKRMPDFNYIQKELLRNGVNKKLLWTEYLEECRQSGDEPLMYSQFCYYIQQDEQKRRATMHINRKPGEQIEVDWAGDPAQITDPDTGEIIPAFLFVGVMTYSQYPYVEAFINEKQRSWITAHVHMYERHCAGIPGLGRSQPDPAAAFDGYGPDHPPVAYLGGCRLRHLGGHRHPVRVPARQAGGPAQPHRRAALRLTPPRALPLSPAARRDETSEEYDP